MDSQPPIESGQETAIALRQEADALRQESDDLAMRHFATRACIEWVEAALRRIAVGAMAELHLKRDSRAIDRAVELFRPETHFCVNGDGKPFLKGPFDFHISDIAMLLISEAHEADPDLFTKVVPFIRPF
jgi:hypothetical protein